jgi:ABC-2 type transport system ATP-binding protein
MTPGIADPPAAIPATVQPVIQTRSLARWYGQVIGLTDLTVDIPPGITGLLGPNGAGKSTFLRLATGQIQPSAGAVRILGRNPVRDPAVFRDIGFCSEDDTLYNDLNPLDMVTFLARCSGYSRREAKERAATALERTGIAYAMKRRTGTFSKGMRQRTRIAAALVHDPRLLLLDEPMTGLDPVGRRDVMDLIRSIAQEGKSVLFSSHILHEVEAVASHVAIINRGMLLAEGTLGEIQRDLKDYAFTLEVACDDPRRLAQRLTTHGHVVSLTFKGDDTVAISTDSSLTLTTELPHILLDLGLDVREIRCPGENLETLFERLMTR